MWLLPADAGYSMIFEVDFQPGAGSQPWALQCRLEREDQIPPVVPMTPAGSGRLRFRDGKEARMLAQTQTAKRSSRGSRRWIAVNTGTVPVCPRAASGVACQSRPWPKRRTPTGCSTRRLAEWMGRTRPRALPADTAHHPGQPMDYAVELGLLGTNPIRALKWTAPRSSARWTGTAS